MPYRAEINDELMAFLAEQFGPDSRQANPDRFRWNYERNPHVRSGRQLLISRSSDGRITGHVGGIHVELSIDGARREMPWGVEPELLSQLDVMMFGSPK